MWTHLVQHSNNFNVQNATWKFIKYLSLNLVINRWLPTLKSGVPSLKIQEDAVGNSRSYNAVAFIMYSKNTAIGINRLGADATSLGSTPKMQ